MDNVERILAGKSPREAIMGGGLHKGLKTEAKSEIGTGGSAKSVKSGRLFNELRKIGVQEIWEFIVEDPGDNFIVYTVVTALGFGVTGEDEPYFLAYKPSSIKSDKVTKIYNKLSPHSELDDDDGDNDYAAGLPK